jgi:hypothetical protein
MGGACSTNGEKGNMFRLLVGKPEGRRSLGRARCKWVDNIRMDLGEVGWGDVDWIAGKLSSGCTTGGPSNNAQLYRVSVHFKQTSISCRIKKRVAFL